MSSPQIVWLRRDLRMADHPALHGAAQAGPVIPLFVFDEDRGGDHAIGAASKVWLHYSLESLGKSFGSRHSRIILRRGDAPQVLAAIADQTGASCIHAMRHYEPWWKEAEDELRDALGEERKLCLYDGNYLLPPGSVTTGSGDSYKIYTPFSKAMLEVMPPRDTLEEPDHISSPESWPESDELEEWGLLPTSPDWAGGIRDFWDFGEDAAHQRLDWWADEVADYDDGRNLPSQDTTSRLSPHLHWGEISPAQVWHKLKDKRSDGWKTFAKEIIWRDYAQNVIDQFPAYPRESYRDYDERTLWRNPNAGHLIEDDLRCWQKGMTGYPIVDAGMRQLWQTGWIHNRVRMICASFLVKHLLIDWRFGEQWYWDCLVDADYANNGVNWQWISGTGVDSNMFSRIMAPLSQSEKFDAADFIRQYVPELAEVEDACIHDPPDDMRGDYPVKMIAHKEARERALHAYRESKT
ncbi:DNA photolyase family protein [Qipengyuania flava]|nr:DNA photolyase family protein [Qipengyuania flava]